jgi:hypothetical protein
MLTESPIAKQLPFSFPLSTLGPAPKFPRGHFQTLPKHARHVRLAGETACDGDVNYPRTFFPERILGASQAQAENVLVRGYSGGGPEHPKEMRAAIPALLRQTI